MKTATKRTMDLAWGFLDNIEAGQIQVYFHQAKMEVEERIQENEKERKRLKEIYQYLNKFV